MNTRRDRAIEIITAGLFFWDGAPDGWNNFEGARAAYFAARNESSSWSSNEGQIRAALGLERTVEPPLKKPKPERADFWNERAPILLVGWVLGLLVWNMVCWSVGGDSGAARWHHHHWLFWVTCAWDLPAAIVAVAGALTFVGWFATGRILLGRWL